MPRLNKPLSLRNVCIHTLQLSNYPRGVLPWIIRFLFKIKGLDVQLDN
jgi:hypothetical protein